MGAGALGKDVQNQRRAVHDLAIERFFQVALLAGRELAVEDDDVAVLLLAQVFELVHLALADVGRRIGLAQPLRDLAHHQHARRARQLAQLGQRVFERPGQVVAVVDAHAHQARPRLLVRRADRLAPLAHVLRAICKLLTAKTCFFQSDTSQS